MLSLFDHLAVRTPTPPAFKIELSMRCLRNALCRAETAQTRSLPGHLLQFSYSSSATLLKWIARAILLQVDTRPPITAAAGRYTWRTGCSLISLFQLLELKLFTTRFSDSAVALSCESPSAVKDGSQTARLQSLPGRPHTTNGEIEPC